jgi:hypothetical protein
MYPGFNRSHRGSAMFAETSTLRWNFLTECTRQIDSGGDTTVIYGVSQGRPVHAHDSDSYQLLARHTTWLGHATSMSCQGTCCMLVFKAPIDYLKIMQPALAGGHEHEVGAICMIRVMRPNLADAVAMAETINFPSTAKHSPRGSFYMTHVHQMQYPRSFTPEN